MPEKIVIIGSGPASWTAAIYAARANLEPVVYEGAISEDNRIKGTLPLGQLNLTTEVENFPGFPEGITGPELMFKQREQAERWGTRIVTQDIVDVDLSRRPFRLKDSEGNTLEAQALVIATGASANYLGLESESRFKNRGVSACAVCDGALPRFRNKPLIVVGGGDSAVEEATYLTKYAHPVYMILRRDVFRASKIMVERALANRRIVLKYNRVVDEVLGNDKHGVTGVRLAATNGDGPETVEASGLFLAIGHTPNTDFLGGQVELTAKGYIKWTTP